MGTAAIYIFIYAMLYTHHTGTTGCGTALTWIYGVMAFLFLCAKEDEIVEQRLKRPPRGWFYHLFTDVLSLGQLVGMLYLQLYVAAGCYAWVLMNSELIHRKLIAIRKEREEKSRQCQDSSPGEGSQESTGSPLPASSQDMETVSRTEPGIPRSADPWSRSGSSART